MSPNQMLFGKPYHLPVNPEHHALWDIREPNFDLFKPVT